jgi:hypothetical protein
MITITIEIEEDEGGLWFKVGGTRKGTPTEVFIGDKCVQLLADAEDMLVIAADVSHAAIIHDIDLNSQN